MAAMQIINEKGVAGLTQEEEAPPKKVDQDYTNYEELD